MKIGSLNTRDHTLIIAEIGNNHEGNFDLAQELVRSAVQAGADAVKFQIFRTEHYITPSDKARYNRLKGFELTPIQFSQLAKQAHDAQVAFIATPFDLASAELTAKICDAIKISSGDNNFYPLIQKVGTVGKPTLLSTGMLDITDLHEPYRILAEALGNDNLALLHCVTSYPVKQDDANVAAVKSLIQEFNCEIGYSDHTIGAEACLAAVACGARIIEKHFTLDHNYSDFRDHQLSANPHELAQLVNRIRQFETLLGSGCKSPTTSETQIEPSIRRSIIARRALPAGHVLKADDLTWVRPAGGMSPGREQELVGNSLCCAVEAGHQLSLDNLEKSP